MSELPEARSSKNEQGKRSHFWVANSNFFRMSFIGSVTPGLGNQFALTLYDCDGTEVNKISLESPEGRLVVCDLEPLMLGCKLQAGIQHGHLIVESQSEASHQCYLHTQDGAGLVKAGDTLDDNSPGFFPVTLTKERTSFVSLVNLTKNTATVLIKFVSGTRSPETTCVLPPLGTRFIDVTSEFPLKTSVEKGLQGYLKIRTATPIGVQLLDYTRSRDIFRVLCSQSVG